MVKIALNTACVKCCMNLSIACTYRYTFYCDYMPEETKTAAHETPSST